MATRALFQVEPTLIRAVQKRDVGRVIGICLANYAAFAVRGSLLVITLNSTTSPQVATFTNDPTAADQGTTIGATGQPALTPAVPEPASVALVLTAVLGLVAWRGRSN